MARLIKRVERLAAASVPEAEDAPLALVWSQHDTKVDAGRLGAGEFIAVDVVRSGVYAGACQLADGTHHDGTEQVVIRERVTTDESDLGWVLTAGGERIGEVTAVRGSLIEWRMFEGDGEEVAGAGPAGG